MCLINWRTELLHKVRQPVISWIQVLIRLDWTGTNAWTDTTNTAYTITTAGSEGFLNILPIFLDHIFYPTLKPSGFVTEVFHINGKAEDSGVVYSEMQGVENTSYMLMDTRSVQDFTIGLG